MKEHGTIRDDVSWNDLAFGQSMKSQTFSLLTPAVGHVSNRNLQGRNPDAKIEKRSSFMDKNR